METVYRGCTLCEAHCGLTYERDGDTVLSVRGDPENAFSQGYVCPKGIANRELHMDGDRLRTPVRRRPDGGFEPIGWDEALALAVSGLRQVKAAHGPNSVGVFYGNPMTHKRARKWRDSDFPLRSAGSGFRYRLAGHESAFCNILLSLRRLLRGPASRPRANGLPALPGGQSLVSNGSLLTAPISSSAPVERNRKSMCLPQRKTEMLVRGCGTGV